MTRYRVVRFYLRHGSRTIKRGLTREQALAHCQDPETSWRTAKSRAAKARTLKHGPWFDGWEEER